MKKTVFYIAILAITALSISCSTGDSGNSDSGNSDTGSGCGTHAGHTLYLGDQGGCFYYNNNGNKVYVERSECHC